MISVDKEAKVEEVEQLEVSIIIPCLNEAKTLANCINEAKSALASYRGEVIVADNGSTDGSPDIARKLGARVLNVPVRGYGSAITAGIEAAHGKFILVGDADESYKFTE